MSERKTFTIRMQPELMKSLKMVSVQKESNVSDLIEEAIYDFLKKNEMDDKKQIKK